MGKIIIIKFIVINSQNSRQLTKRKKILQEMIILKII
jgi:hypothetical protein